MSNWRILSDHNEPEPLSKWLEEQGHYVVRSKFAVGQEAPDPVVAKYAIENDLTLISWDKDFGHQRFMAPRYSGLSRMGFSCPEPMAIERAKEVYDVLDFLVTRSGTVRFEIRIARDKVLFRDRWPN